MYTDGSSRGNPGPGGYGVVLMSGSRTKELSQGYRRTTNNRMELMAVIAGLEALKKTNLKITVYSDSQYVVKAVKEGWLNKWLATNFAKGKKNKDLWVKFYDLFKKHQVKLVKKKRPGLTVLNQKNRHMRCQSYMLNSRQTVPSPMI